MRYICGYIKSNALVVALTFLVVVESLGSQETIDQLFGDDLVADGLYFDGETSFDEETGALTFLISGLIQNPKLKARYAQYEKNADSLPERYAFLLGLREELKKGKDVFFCGPFVSSPSLILNRWRTVSVWEHAGVE